MDEFQSIFVEEFGLKKSATFPNAGALKEWYLERNGSEFDLDKIDADTTATIDSPGALYTQRISATESKKRNSFILSVIGRMLGQYDRVMVVYGVGHLYDQQLVLEKMMGM